MTEKSNDITTTSNSDKSGDQAPASRSESQVALSPDMDYPDPGSNSGTSGNPAVTNPDLA